MSDVSYKRLFWVVLIGSAIVRLVQVDLPFLEGSATRQIYNLMVAKTFYEENLNLFFPKMYINGNETYYSALEFQFIPFIAALFYKVMGGVYPVVFRLMSIVFTLLSMVVLFKLVEAFIGKAGALISIVLFSVSPISIYLGRAANYEMAIIFFNIATLYGFYQWTQTEKPTYAWFSSICFVFAVLLKIPNLYLLFPVAFMAFQKWGWGSFKKNWIFFSSFIFIFAGQGWLQYIRTLSPHDHWVHFSLSHNIESMIRTFTSIEFYKKIYTDALHYVLSPIGLSFALLGLLLTQVRKEERFFYVWLASVILFYIAIPETFWVHSYYHIHYLPIACYFIAKVALYLSKNARPALVLVGVFHLLISARYAIPFYWVPETKKHVLATAPIAQQHVPKESLIISNVDSASTLLYYADRRGWSLKPTLEGREAIRRFKKFHAKGAQYFVSADKPALVKNPLLYKHLRVRHPVTFENGYSIIFDLSKDINNH